MSEAGYIHLHRRLIGHPAFRNDGEAMAFAWMCLRASWQPVRVRYKGIAVRLERGQLAVSVRDLAESLDRPKGWVERLLNRLKNEDMIGTHAETGVTVITIRKYDDFQPKQDTGRTVRGTPDGTAAGQRQDTEQRREKGKEGKNDDDDVGARADEIVVIPTGLPTDLIDLTADLCRAAGVRHIDPAHVLRAQQTVRGWMTDGFDPETEIIPAIRQGVADATERISALAYFDPIIRQARARKEAADHGHRPRNDHRPRSRAHRSDEMADAYRDLGFGG